MALLGKADWQSFLSPDSEIPPDVFFRVTREDGKWSKIGAHRMPLAAISPVFRRMFFGPLKETKEVVEVKETSPGAFRAMINYIYASCPQNVLRIIKCPQTLFELFALSDRYDIQSLRNEVFDLLWNFWIDRENMIAVATVANSYRALFVEPSTELLLNCFEEFLDLDPEEKETFPVDISQMLMEVGRSFLQLSGNQGAFREHNLDRVLQTGAP